MKKILFFTTVLAIIACIVEFSSVYPQEYNLQAVLKDREGAFMQWRKAHPNTEEQIADLKAKTAALVAKPGKDVLPSNRNKDSKPIVWRVDGAVTELWDHPDAPQLMIIPAGAFVAGLDPKGDRDPEPQMKGSSSSKAAPMAASTARDERRPVTIAYPFALSKYDVTRAEFEQFTVETGYKTDGPCSVRNGEQWTLDETKSWSDPGFKQGSNDPAVCVSWNDAEAYAAWISSKTGKEYRLPSAAEYEYAAAGGTSGTTFWFGSRASHDYMNYGSDDLCAGGACTPLAKGNDKWLYTSPVGSFPANPFGLYDMNGNVRQWVADCNNTEGTDLPADGSANSEDCSKRQQRSGSWNSVAAHGFPGGNHSESTDYRSSSLGFRLARTL
jgi:formylglycine-generating enzyme required for sulfatase activity